MKIIYADDAPEMLEEVCDFLFPLGHQVVPIETNNLLVFQEQLNLLLEKGFKADYLIIGGHNHLKSGTGENLFDLDAFSLRSGLETLEQAARLADNENAAMFQSVCWRIGMQVRPLLGRQVRVVPELELMQVTRRRPRLQSDKAGTISPDQRCSISRP